MTIQNVFDRLGRIGRESEKLLKDTGFDRYEGLWENVSHLPDPCEDKFIRGKAEELLGYLSEINGELRYLQMPPHGEFILHRLPNGRYGYLDEDRQIRTFTCGECLEAKIPDRCGNYQWAESSIEHDGNDYYLVGFRSTPLDGLTVRERW